MTELSCRNKFGGAAVDMGFECGLVVDQVTGWMNDNEGQQRLHVEGQLAGIENDSLWQQESKRLRRA